MKVCIDSQIIIWGIKKQATQGQEDMIARAEHFFHWADTNGHEIIIPSVVEAEILAAEPETIRPIYQEILHKNFMIVTFDSRAAAKYAEILNNRFEELKKIAKNNNIERQKMKIDHLIISCALANGANSIYTYDKGIITFAKGYIDVRELPKVPLKQQNLFGQDIPF